MSRMRDDPALRRSVAARLEGLPTSPTKPAFGKIMLDRVGRMWVSEAFHVFEQPTNWSIIDMETGALATMSVPEGFEIYEAGVDFVLGKWTDELGVEFVRLYGLSLPEQ